MPDRPAPLLSLGAALLVAVLGLASCADGGGPADEPTTQTSDAVETPVAGSGAGIDPTDLGSWCGAITPEQLSGASGLEVADITSDGDGVQACTADLPGAELLITWGSETTTKSFERYAADFDRPAGLYEVTEVSLAGDQPAVVAVQDGVRTAFTGTVLDGRTTQVAVIAVADQDADTQELGDLAQQLLAVYVG